MRTRIASVALWIVALLFVSQNASAQSFEGRITQTISSPQLGDAKFELVMNFKGEKMMANADMGPMGQSKIYIDKGAKTVTVIQGSQKSGLQVDYPQESGSGANTDQAKATSTGKKETINGYAAEEWLVDLGDGNTMSFWITPDIDKSVRKAMEEANRIQDMSNPSADVTAFRRMMSEKGMMEVRVVISQGGEIAGIIDIAKIEKVSIPDSTFQIPSDVTVQKMEGQPGQEQEGHEGHGH